MVDNDRVRAEEISRANAFVASAMSTIPDADRSIVTAEMKRMDAAVKLLKCLGHNSINPNNAHVYVKSWHKLASNAVVHLDDVGDDQSTRVTEHIVTCNNLKYRALSILAPQNRSRLEVELNEMDEKEMRAHELALEKELDDVRMRGVCQHVSGNLNNATLNLKRAKKDYDNAVNTWRVCRSNVISAYGGSLDQKECVKKRLDEAKDLVDFYNKAFSDAYKEFCEELNDARSKYRLPNDGVSLNHTLPGKKRGKDTKRKPVWRRLFGFLGFKKTSEPG